MINIVFLTDNFSFVLNLLKKVEPSISLCVKETMESLQSMDESLFVFLL